MRWVLRLVIAALLAACGGGSAGDSLLRDFIEPAPDAPGDHDAAVAMYMPGLHAGEAVRVRGWAGGSTDQDWYTVTALDSGTVIATLAVDTRPYEWPILGITPWVNIDSPDGVTWPATYTADQDAVELPVEAGDVLHVEILAWGETGGGYALTIELRPAG